MTARWDLGDGVRVVRNVRNDGTYPGEATGALLVRRGSVGTVVGIGTFLQDQVIYSVHFLSADRIVGCRDEELIGANDAWFPSVFESRERIAAARTLSLGAGERIPGGSLGEVLRVLRNPGQIVYHIHFDCLPGRIFAVPESALVLSSELNHA